MFTDFPYAFLFFFFFSPQLELALTGSTNTTRGETIRRIYDCTTAYDTRDAFAKSL
jgi:hypothetical protein